MARHLDALEIALLAGVVLGGHQHGVPLPSVWHKPCISEASVNTASCSGKRDLNHLGRELVPPQAARLLR